jgi:hypothetical protein
MDAEDAAMLTTLLIMVAAGSFGAGLVVGFIVTLAICLHAASCTDRKRV